MIPALIDGVWGWRLVNGLVSMTDRGRREHHGAAARWDQVWAESPPSHTGPSGPTFTFGSHVVLSKSFKIKNTFLRRQN